LGRVISKKGTGKRQRKEQREDAQAGEVGCPPVSLEAHYGGQAPGTLHHVIVRRIEKRRIIEDCGIPLAEAGRPLGGFHFCRFQYYRSKKELFNRLNYISYLQIRLLFENFVGQELKAHCLYARHLGVWRTIARLFPGGTSKKTGDGRLTKEDQGWTRGLTIIK